MRDVSGFGSSTVDGWIEAAQHGCFESFGRAVQACRQYLLLIANRELPTDVRGKAGASDLVQQTFIDALRKFGQFHGRTEHELKFWLRKILRNNVATAVRGLRSGKRDVGRESPLGVAGSEPVDPTADEVTPCRSLARSEVEAALWREIDRLPKRDRAVFAWRHEEGCPFDEIGRRLGTSAEAARKVWARAILRLRAGMGAFADDSY